MFPPQEHIAGAQGAEKAWLAKTGHRVWTSATLGQVAIESAFLKAQSGVNNFGGIKANKAEIATGKFRKCPTHEEINGQSIPVLADFASYDSIEDFYEAHGRVIATYSGYRAGWAAKTADEFLAGIAHPYATAKKEKYIAAVKGVMDHYGLRKYDLCAAELPAPAPKPSAFQGNKAAGVLVGASAAATTAAHAAASHLDGVPWPWIGAAALVAAEVGVLVMLAKRKVAAAHAHAVSIPAMTIEQVHAYLGLPAPPAVPLPPPIVPVPPSAPASSVQAPTPNILAAVAALSPEPRSAQ
jgi:hypothetical protein